MLKIEHVPMVHIDILETETGFTEREITFGINSEAEVFFLDTSINETLFSSQRIRIM